jgi:tetratricopeptide (TPR) repeat protein
MKKFLLLLVAAISGIHAKQDTQNLHRYLLANYYQFGQDFKSAGHWYSQIDPDNASMYIYNGYIPYLAATGAHDQIVKIIGQLDEPMAQNYEIQLLFANALEQVGKKVDAHERLIQLNEKNKSNQELAFRVAQIYIENAEPENALRVIDGILNSAARRPNNYVFYFLKSQIYLSLNNKKEALIAVKQCIDVYPRFDKSWLLYAMLLEQEGKLEEAIKGYQHFLEITTEPKGQIERHVMSLSFRQKLNPKTKEDDVVSRLERIQELAYKSHYGTAAKLLEEWATHGNPEIWIKTLHLLTYIGMPLSTAHASFATIEKKYPALESLALYQAEISLRMNNYAHTVPALQRAYNLSSNPSLKMQIAYQLATQWYDHKEWKKARELLEQAHNYYDQYAPSHNLLAYIYATKANSFDLAHHAIEKALKLDPTNSHFLDTKAQLLAKQKKFDEALQVWGKIAPEHQDFTMLCHQGKCQLLAGKKQDAITTIKNAQTVAQSKKEKDKAIALLAQASK